jgi:hypothetical protein
MHFGEDLTQGEIGARVGLSQMQVSRLLRRALQHMQTVAAAIDRRESPGPAANRRRTVGRSSRPSLKSQPQELISCTLPPP